MTLVQKMQIAETDRQTPLMVTSVTIVSTDYAFDAATWKCANSELFF